MQVIIRPTREQAAWLTARLIAQALRDQPTLTLGLATGRTMERLYAMLVQMHRDEGLDFSRCCTFNLDEYVGLPPEHENSYRSYMCSHFFNHVNIEMKQTHLADGMAADLGAECRRYEELIKQCGGIDLQLLGLGQAGHIGFNEPLSALRSRTRDKSLTPMTVAENSRLFKDPAAMPRRALTMGVGTILECKRLIMLVTGETKAEVLAQAVEGPITSMVSASAIQLHENCIVVVDEAAAAKLRAQDYYRWIFDNEPAWEMFRSE